MMGIRSGVVSIAPNCAWGEAAGRRGVDDSDARLAARNRGVADQLIEFAVHPDRNRRAVYHRAHGRSAAAGNLARAEHGEDPATLLNTNRYARHEPLVQVGFVRSTA